MSTSRFVWDPTIFALFATLITASLAVPVGINMTALASELIFPLPIRDAFQSRDCKPVCVKTPNPRECVTDCVNDLYGFLDYCTGFRIECDFYDLSTEEGRKKCSCECKQLMGEQIECLKVAPSSPVQTRATATKPSSAQECCQVKANAERATRPPIRNHRNLPGALHGKKPSMKTNPVSQPYGTLASASPATCGAATCEGACAGSDDADQCIGNCKKDQDAFREAQCQDYTRSCQEDKDSEQCTKDCAVKINVQSTDGSRIEIDNAVPNALRNTKMSEENLCMNPESDLCKSSKIVNRSTSPRVPTATSKPNSADVESCAVACNKGAKKWYPQPEGADDCDLTQSDFDELPCAQSRCQNDCMMNALKWWRKICHLEHPEMTEKECNGKIGFIYSRAVPEIDEDNFRGF